MILFFGSPKLKIFAVEISEILLTEDLKKLSWVLDSRIIDRKQISEKFIGPKSSMVTPWSTNAVEITRNMGVKNINRIEVFICHEISENFDKMIHEEYEGLNQNIFNNNITPEKIYLIDNLKKYNNQQGLALDDFEISYLESLSEKIGRKLTDSEVYGFSQVNSEHCRHKIFNGKFIIDGKEKNDSLFDLIKFTSKKNKNSIVSAYSDNVAFINGPKISQFQPKRGDKSSYFITKEIESIISVKAETHNFPTTVEPYNGAATGSGGEIRDRAAGGTGSLPLIGSAVYMTPYSRLNNNKMWEKKIPQRDWKYQTPVDILIKASNGASDFGNCFGQPLIVGSLLTFEHDENQELYSYDKVIMLAGGVGYGELKQSMKKSPKKGDIIVLLGGDNYRIGMGGASVSSTDTGSYNNAIELNAIQRSNPEMQKRVTNTIRSLFEMDENPIVSIHDHGAGGHLNCFSELVEDVGGEIYLDSLPIGDPSLSYKEIIGNESQERIGLIIKEKDYELVNKIAERERAPVYKVGKVTGDNKFKVIDRKNNSETINLDLDSLFGDVPKKVVNDITKANKFKEIEYDGNKVSEYLENVLMLESVACKDWLTNKVDRCVTGRVAQQQTVGEIQVPLSNCGVVSLDYANFNGIASSIGHSPISGLIDPSTGSINSIGESLTNIIWAPLEKGLKSVTLSANWMWPCNNPGEDARLYNAVEACSSFAIDLGINIPTGKDSLSMKQKYKDKEVISPGTVIISAAGNCNNISNVIEPVFINNANPIYYIDLSNKSSMLGGTAFAQTLGKIGNKASDVCDSQYSKKVFNVFQDLIKKEFIISGHDISSGGLITTLLEMCFAENEIGADIDLSFSKQEDIIKLLFSENLGIVFQAKPGIEKELDLKGISFNKIGKVNNSGVLGISKKNQSYEFLISKYRDIWYNTSYLLDINQSGKIKAQERFENYKNQPLKYSFPKNFNGLIKKVSGKKIKAAVIREKGSNSEREMAYAMNLVGFDVKDVHMTDLISGRENLEDINFIVAVGGFSNSDVLGSAKGWAGSFLYNEKARSSLMNFYSRKNTLSLGVCNGCQLFIELGLLHTGHKEKPKMTHNDSQKFECIFTSVEIQKNESVMFNSLSGSKLGIWSAHGEGKFILPYSENKYQIIGKYGYESYPANPNGSNYNTAILSNEDGRHIAMMPHLERSTFQWNWPFYPKNRKDEISPWIIAFENAKTWLEKK